MTEPIINAARVAARKAGRDAATEIFSLLSLPDGYGADFTAAFCEELNELTPKKAADVAAAKPKPLEPVRRLGATQMEYGVYRGNTYDEIPLERLDWYLRMAEANVKSLRDYLTHPELKSYRSSS